MNDMIVSSVRVLLKDDIVRLAEVKTLYMSVYNIFTRVMKNCMPFEKVFFKYISNYNNIFIASDIKEIMDNFKKEINYPDLFDFNFFKDSKLIQEPDIFVKFEIYKLFYYSWWPEYVKALRATLEKGKNGLVFRYRIKKEFIKRVYKSEEEPFKEFEKDISELFYANEISVTIKKNNEVYLIEV